jgi:catechol 2,3-dioxygenase-like lactoylglutathione lyase family enzyme
MLIWANVKRYCRLHKYGMGIHLLQRGSLDSNAPPPVRPPAINPKGNHISFQVMTAAAVTFSTNFSALVSRRLIANMLLCILPDVIQCTDMVLMKARLADMELEFVAAWVRDGETVVEQLFFHDPDGNVIEICDCEKLPVVPLAGAGAAVPSLLLPVHDG